MPVRRTSYRNEKLPELIARLAAEFVVKESNGTSLITVTGCDITPDGHKARIRFTVLPDNQEEAARDFLQRKRDDFKKFVDDHARIGRMPQVTFTPDSGEKNRQKIDFLSKNE